MSVYRIIDFQGHFVDLVNGAQGDDVPIQSYTKAAPGNGFNQQWEITQQPDKERVEIKNQRNQVISYGTGPLIRQQVKTSTSHTYWKQVRSGSGYKFIQDNGSVPLALTAWACRLADHDTSPITLEPVVDGDMQQVFTLEKVNLTQIARIVTFEGQYVDLTNGLKDTYVPITAHRKALPKYKLNQEWKLEETSDEGYIRIVNNGAQQIMSYPSANVRQENVLRQQAMAHPTADTVWQRVVCGAGYKFIINDPLHGKLALTAWPVRAANKDESPLTLEREIEGDKQQVFNIETALA